MIHLRKWHLSTRKIKSVEYTSDKSLPLSVFNLLNSTRVLIIFTVLNPTSE